MSKTFLSDIIASAGGEMMNAGREQIEYININTLHEDDRNFYSMDKSSIADLAASIELAGLQQPIRVRDIEGRYVIVSGHRRFSAIRSLYEKNDEKWRDVPCIVESDTVSAAMQELRLILANSATRKLSDSDIAKQAERTTELLYQLKEEGVQFPGSMRKHVAEACQISETKLATLKVIREKLNPVLLKRFDSGDLSTEVAYIFAKADEKTQAEIAYKIGHVKDLGNITIVRAKDLVESVKSGMAEGMVSPAPKKSDDRIDFDAIDYIVQIRKEDLNLMELLSGEYRIFFSLYGSDGATRNECIDGLKKGLRNFGHYDGEWDIEGSPRGVSFKNLKTGKKISRTFTELWDLLAISCIASAASEDDDVDEAEEPTKTPEV